MKKSLTSFYQNGAHKNIPLILKSGVDATNYDIGMSTIYQYTDVKITIMIPIPKYLYRESSTWKITVKLTANAVCTRGFIARDSHETRANLRMWIKYSLE